MAEYVSTQVLTSDMFNLNPTLTLTLTPTLTLTLTLTLNLTLIPTLTLTLTLPQAFISDMSRRFASTQQLLQQPAAQAHAPTPP
jgi:hypothetical protein